MDRPIMSRRVAEYLLSRRIPTGHHPVQVLADDGITGRFDNRGQTALHRPMSRNCNVYAGRNASVAGLQLRVRESSAAFIAQPRLWIILG